MLRWSQVDFNCLDVQMSWQAVLCTLHSGVLRSPACVKVQVQEHTHIGDVHVCYHFVIPHVCDVICVQVYV